MVVGGCIGHILNGRVSGLRAEAGPSESTLLLAGGHPGMARDFGTGIPRLYAWLAICFYFSRRGPLIKLDIRAQNGTCAGGLKSSSTDV